MIRQYVLRLTFLDLWVHFILSFFISCVCAQLNHRCMPISTHSVMSPDCKRQSFEMHLLNIIPKMQAAWDELACSWTLDPSALVLTVMLWMPLASPPLASWSLVVVLTLTLPLGTVTVGADLCAVGTYSMQLHVIYWHLCNGWKFVRPPH